jgi:hypothetical protein
MAVHRRPAMAGASLAPWVMHRPWRARIFVAGRNCHLGYFCTREEARAAHDAAVKERLGEAYLKSNARAGARCGTRVSEDIPAS